MDNSEAKEILSSFLSVETGKGYSALRALVLQKHIESFEAPGPSGALYKIEFQYFWDDKPEDVIRVIGAIDDGGFRAYCPLSMSELLARPV